MPVAIPFESEEVDNGFPSCLSIIDVSSYDRWTTLSGVNKDNVGSFTASELEDKIQESLVLAMKLYWNGFSVDAFAQGVFNSDIATADGADTSASQYDEPKNRVCGFASGVNDDSIGSTSASININFRLPTPISNGSTFVGYAASAEPVSLVGRSAGGPRTSLFVAGEIISEIPDPSSNHIYDYAYVSVSGFSFVCQAEARRGSTSYTLVADAANLNAEVVGTIGGAIGREARCSITSLDDFYTYPT